MFLPPPKGSGFPQPKKFMNDNTILIIAEKPSVAVNIVQAIPSKFKEHNGYFDCDKYVVSWAYGHLYELYSVQDYEPEWGKVWKLENYPYFPDRFKYKVKKGAEKQVDVLKKISRQCGAIYIATDNDREGQLIGNLIVNELNVQKPVFRLLLNEWTEDTVRDAIYHPIINDHMQYLYNAGKARQWADWLIGINLTVATTLVLANGKKVLPVGRVLLPTLKILYDREIEIENFVEKKRFRIIGVFKNEKGDEIETTLIFKNTEGEIDKYFEDRDEVVNICNMINDAAEHRAYVDNAEKKNKKTYPPHLFNLTLLQGEITNSRENFTAEKVLEVAQKLYEKKLITYPRTSSLALEETLINKATKLFDNFIGDYPGSIRGKFKFSKSKRIFDNKKVESHSAIIPTMESPNDKNLSEDERFVYQVIKDRFMASFLPPYEYEESRYNVKLEADGKRYNFSTSGKTEINAGWKELYNRKALPFFPSLSKGETLSFVNTHGAASVTKPPSYHTEKSLLHVMETCGKKVNDEEEHIKAILSGYSIGTSATRADTISKLQKNKMIEKKKKALRITPLGRKLIELFPVKSLLDLEYTGKLEYKLSKIEKNEYDINNYILEVKDLVKDAYNDFKRIELKEPISGQRKENKVIGICPRCHGNILESSKGFYCNSIQTDTPCGFFLSKNQPILKKSKKRLTKSMVEKILEKGITKVNGLVSKSGSIYNAYLTLQDDGKWVNLKLIFK